MCFCKHAIVRLIVRPGDPQVPRPESLSPSWHFFQRDPNSSYLYIRDPKFTHQSQVLAMQSFNTFELLSRFTRNKAMKKYVCTKYNYQAQIETKIYTILKQHAAVPFISSTIFHDTPTDCRTGKPKFAHTTNLFHGTWSLPQLVIISNSCTDLREAFPRQYSFLPSSIPF